MEKKSNPAPGHMRVQPETQESASPRMQRAIQGVMSGGADSPPVTPYFGSFERLQRKCAACEQEEGVQRKETGIVSRIQPRLEVGAADDPQEREADQVAAQVVQRQQMGAAEPPEESPVMRLIQRNVQRAVQRKGMEGSFEPSADFQQGLESQVGRGSALDENTRSRMEQGFGADFSGVRIHTGTQADQLNRQIQAKAFTYGNDIFFRQGNYDTQSTEGNKLLAHELTHTVQQTGHVERKVQRTIDEDLAKVKELYEKQQDQKDKQKVLNAGLQSKENDLKKGDPDREKLLTLQRQRFEADERIKDLDKEQKKLLAKYKKKNSKWDKKFSNTESSDYRLKLDTKNTDLRASTLQDLMASYKLEEQAIRESNAYNEQIKSIKQGLMGPMLYLALLEAEGTLTGVNPVKEIPGIEMAEDIRYRSLAEYEIDMIEQEDDRDKTDFETYKTGKETTRKEDQKKFKDTQKIADQAGLDAIASTLDPVTLQTRQLEIDNRYKKATDLKTPAKAVAKAYSDGEKPKSWTLGDVAMIVNILLSESPKWDDKDLILKFLMKYDPDLAKVNELFGYEERFRISPKLYVSVMTDPGLTSKERRDAKGETKPGKLKKTLSYNNQLLMYLNRIETVHTQNKQLKTDQTHGLYADAVPADETVSTPQTHVGQFVNNLGENWRKKGAKDYDVIPINFLDASTYFSAWEYQKRINEAGSDMDKMQIAWEYYQLNYPGDLASSSFVFTPPPPTDFASFQTKILKNNVANVQLVFYNVDKRFIGTDKKVRDPMSKVADPFKDMGKVVFPTLMDAFNLREYWELFNKNKLSPLMKKVGKHPLTITAASIAGAGLVGWNGYEGFGKGNFTGLTAFNMWKLDKKKTIFDHTQNLGSNVYNQKLSWGLTNKFNDNVFNGQAALNEYFGQPGFAQAGYNPSKWFAGKESVPRIGLGGTFDYSSSRTLNPLMDDPATLGTTKSSFNLSGGLYLDWMLSRGANPNPPAPGSTQSKLWDLGNPGHLAWQANNLGGLNWGMFNPLPIWSAKDNDGDGQKDKRWDMLTIYQFYNGEKMNKNLNLASTNNIFTQRGFLNAKGKVNYFNFGVNTGFMNAFSSDANHNIQIFAIDPTIGVSDVPVPIPGLSGKFSASLTSQNTFATNVSQNARYNILSGTARYDGRYVTISGTFRDDLNKNAESTSWEVRLEANIPIAAKNEMFSAKLFFATGQEAGNSNVKARQYGQVGLLLHLNK